MSAKQGIVKKATRKDRKSKYIKITGVGQIARKNNVKYKYTSKVLINGKYRYYYT